MNAPPTRKFPALIGVTCIVIIAAIGFLQNLSGVTLSRIAPLADPPFDSITLNERRFTALKFVLLNDFRPLHGTVGYLSDLDPQSTAWSSARFLAQYSLAPLLLSPAPPFQFSIMDPAMALEWHTAPRPVVNPEWFVGNFSNSFAAPAIAASQGLFIVRDFGAGVVLLRQASR